LRVVVWNTASATAEKPRWRAFVPTTHAMSMDVHALTLAQIENNDADPLHIQPAIKKGSNHF
ncbi:hypothetical protein, partial [Methylobacterium sp. ap11]|uniref:hypothetical protein n=1 Tax=Methylobacterium sp. ap11 TaxID=1761799 RepID=UPI0015A6F32C